MEGGHMLIGDGSGKPLLDWLANMSGCEYLSDLRYDSTRRLEVHKVLEKLTPEDMPLEAWQTVAEYLLSVPVHGKTAAELYAALLDATT